MSDYPPTPSYGQKYRSQDQTNPPYLPPTYPAQYMQPDDGRGAQGHMASNYDTSMSAFAYNRALPTFSAAAVASGVPPLPIYQGWNQDVIPLPPFNAPQNTTQYSSYSNNLQTGSQYYTPPAHQNYPASMQPAKHYEQGELSEGEFEDGGVPSHSPPVGYGGASQYGNGGTSFGNNTPHAGYSGSQDFNAQQSYPANNYQYPRNPSTQIRRQQSDSYSPYVSPAVADREDQYNGDKHINGSTSTFVKLPETSTPMQTQYKAPQKIKPASIQSSSHINGDYNPQSGLHNVLTKASASSAPAGIPSVGNGKTVAESRKKAEAAILNLLPYEVRYQTYIDEGFREEIIGPLFDGLKMPRNSAKPSSTTSSRPAPQQVPQSIKTSIPTEPRMGGTTSGAHPGAESRKEALELVIPSNQSTNAQSTPPAPKSAAMTEKERTLQSKMEALRKSREERAQKQAAAKDVAKPVEKPPTVPATLAKPEIPIAEPAPSAAASDSPSELPFVPKSEPKIASNPLPSKSPAPTNTPQVRQQPSIPGLFLASTAGAGIPGRQMGGSSTPVPLNSNGQRKRPVAADFDDTASMTPYKRPFGHHRNDQPLVINVSDDDAESEDEDIAMDLDSPGDQDSPRQPERKMSGNRPAVLQGSAQLFDKVKKPFTPPPFSSANNTPPHPSNLPKPVHTNPADLERSIKEMKRKIAEAEAKARAKQTPTRALTPQHSKPTSSEARDAPITTSTLAGKVETAVKMQQLVTVAQGQVNSDQQKLVDAQAAEAEQAAELLKNELEQKQLLRQKNATSQSLIDAEVLQTRTKLEELRVAMAEAEAAYQKSLEEKQRLKEEAERLEQEAVFQAQKDKLQDLTMQRAVETTDRPTFSSHADDTPQSAPSATPDLPSSSTSEEPQQGISNPPTISANSEPLPMELDHVHNITNGTQVPSDEPERPADAQNKETVNSAPTNQALEAALQEAVRAEADLHAPEDDTEMDVEMDIEDSYAPDPNILAPESTSSAVMEDMDSPEYSPVLHRTVPEIQDRDDDYEPPEAVAPVEAPVPDSPPFSPEPAIDEPVDVTPSSPAPAILATEPKANEVNNINSTQASSENGQNGAGELLPFVIGSSPKLVELGSETVSKTPKYTPYESPLKRFRAYRFHPKFHHDIAGGLRSKTYSHKIDAYKEFCYWELTGGTCSDSTCDLQHFKDIVLQDDAVLTALGSPEEFKDEQRDKFCEGLKEVLMDLRVRKIRDFDIIASEIVAHRTKFLGDSSKVLALAGTTI